MGDGGWQGSCPACEAALSHGAVIRGGEVCPDHVELRLVVVNEPQLARILRELHQLGLAPRVVGRASYIHEPELTDDQLRLLKAAYEMGLFDDRRKATIKDLAARLGLSPAAVDRKLRRILKRLVEHHLASRGLA